MGVGRPRVQAAPACRRDSRDCRAGDRGHAGREHGHARLDDRRRESRGSGLMRGDVAEMEGISALPRRNGELVFTDPWESRAFGIAVTASEAGAYDWEEFRQGLIAEIAVWEAEHTE